MCLRTSNSDFSLAFFRKSVNSHACTGTKGTSLYCKAGRILYQDSPTCSEPVLRHYQKNELIKLTDEILPATRRNRASFALEVFLQMLLVSCIILFSRDSDCQGRDFCLNQLFFCLKGLQMLTKDGTGNICLFVGLADVHLG